MVKVKLFANFREIIGRDEIEVSAITLLELLEFLANNYPKLRFLIFRNGEISDYVNVAVNGKIVKDYNIKLKYDDVVAIFPPVSGG